MSARVWIAGASRPRAAVEAGLVVFALILPLSAILRPALASGLARAGVPVSESGWPVLGIGLAYAGYFAGLLGAVRLGGITRAGKGLGPRLGYEVVGALGVVLAAWVGALLAHVVGAAWAAASGPANGSEELALAIGSPALAAASATAAALAYPLFRSAMIGWIAWDRLRRTRLLWELTHAQLIASLLLALGVAGYSAASVSGDNLRFGPSLGLEALPKDASAVAVLLAWLMARLLPALTELLVLSVIAAALLIPPAALISFLVLRRTTRRLEELAGATGALRAGELSARVSVAGKDEVGHLQADFNAMAADLERTLHDLQAEQERVAGLLEARRQLVASVSHELRTPLATARGYLESALDRDGAVPIEVRADLEAAQREATRLERLIDDLFALSRAEVGRLELRLEPTDIGEVIRRVVDSTAPLAWRQRKVQVLAEVVPDLPPARADTGRLEQVVSNLLGNAVRHTPPGGLVAVAVSAEPNAVRVEVRDTGEGITAEEMSRVFERFYRGSGEISSSDGAGLGLALVKELTEAMGGSVGATSAPGEGSCFVLSLPRA